MSTSRLAEYLRGWVEFSIAHQSRFVAECIRKNKQLSTALSDPPNHCPPHPGRLATLAPKLLSRIALMSRSQHVHVKPPFWAPVHVQKKTTAKASIV
jgi:hypothetical protein